MRQPSFVHVPQAGFSAFDAEFSSGPWALVDTSAYYDPSRPLWNASLTVVVKLRLKRAVDALLQVISGSGRVRACDCVWDACQKELSALLDAASASNDPAKREAAARLRNLLLPEADERQMKLRYEEEVDFGRLQLSLVEHGQAEADVALLGLEPLLAEIANATDSLADSIRQGFSTEPQKQTALAVANCVNVFGWAANSLTWMVEQGAEGPEKDLANALLESLWNLSSRYGFAPQSKRSRNSAPPRLH